MDNNKDSTVAGLPASATETSQNAPATPATETNANHTTTSSALPSGNGPVPEITRDAQPPSYEEQPHEVMPAPAPAATTTTTSPSLEKTAWQSATQTPVPQPGQGLVAAVPVDINTLGEEPRLVNCPFCHHQAMTRVQKESTSSTGLAAVGCCLFGGIICAFLPYCMEMCHDSHHFCTNCGQKVAIRPHDGQVQVFWPQQPVVTAPGQVQAPQAVAMTPENMGKK